MNGAVDTLAAISTLLVTLGLLGVAGFAAAVVLGVFDWGLDVDLGPSPEETPHV